MKKFLKNFNLLGFLMLMLGVVLGVGDVSGAVFADGAAVTVRDGEAHNATTTDSTTGVKTAVDTDGTIGLNHGRGRAVQALETTDYRLLRPEMIEDPVEQEIVKMRPSLTPLDTIMRYSKGKSTTNFEYGWYSTDIRPVEGILSDVRYTQNAATPEAFSVTFDVDAADVLILAVSDTLLIPHVVDDEGDPLVLYINKIAGQTVTCSVSDSQISKSSSYYTLSTLANDWYTQKLATSSSSKDACPYYRLGRAASETDVLTEATSVMPTKSKGYCQIFKCQIAQSAYEKMMKKEIQWNEHEIEEQVLFEYKLAMEASFWFGKKGKFWNKETKKTIYATGGILSQIDKHVELNLRDAENGTAALVALTKDIFQGNAGAKTRLLFAGSDFVETLSTIESVQKQVDSGNTMTAWGIEWKTITTNFGRLMLVQHDLFDLYGMSDKAVVIDPEFIDKYTMQGLERFEVKAKESAILNGDITVFTETSGLAVRYPSVHAIIDIVPKAAA